MNQSEQMSMETISANKIMNQIINFPLYLINFYLGVTLVLFFISPMFADSQNGYLAFAYGCAAMICFSIGFKSAARSALRPLGRAQPEFQLLNFIILAMCVVNIMVFMDLFRTAYSYYGFNSAAEIWANLGENYHKKGALMEEISNNSLGLFYTFVNLVSITQVAPYTLAFFCKEKLNAISKAALVASALLTASFYISIGTMSGIFNILVLLACGWLCKAFLFSLENDNSLLRASRQARSISLKLGVLCLFFFSFMVMALGSRMERNLLFSVNIFFDHDSLVYLLLGEKLGDAFCVALFYVYSGWYGLGNSLGLDFEWTGFHSFSRVLDSYMIRFSGEITGTLPYPVRQEAITGYPALAYWHTIFPWFASDFTFVGTLVITMICGAVYGWTWVKAIREGCLLSATLFGILSIGALFINANSQILDSKILALAVVDLLLLMPFRQNISNIR
jgi:hypothetical protein